MVALGLSHSGAGFIHRNTEHGPNTAIKRLTVSVGACAAPEQQDLFVPVMPSKLKTFVLTPNKIFVTLKHPGEALKLPLCVWECDVCVREPCEIYNTGTLVFVTSLGRDLNYSAPVTNYRLLQPLCYI